MSERALSQIEQAMTLTDQAYGLVAIGVLRLRRAPRPAVLRRALNRVQARHPLLQVRIVPDGKAFTFEALEPVSMIPLDVLERQDENQWQAHAQQMLNERFVVSQGPLMRCAYLISQTPEQSADLICAFHHAIMDAPSATHLYDELLALCASLPGHDEVEPVAPLALQPPAETVFPKGYTGLRLARRLIPFVARQVLADWRYRQETKGRYHPSLPSQGACHLVSTFLPEPKTRALVKKTRRERVSLNSALAAAQLLAVYHRRYPPEARPMRTLVFSNLRPYLQPPLSVEHLGCYISMQRVSVPVAPQDTLWTIARFLNEAIYSANKRGEKYLAARLSKRIMQRTLRNQDERMATMALSYVGPLSLNPTYGTIEVADVHGFITTNRLSPEWSAFGHIFRRRLRMDFMYMTTDMDANEASALAKDVRHLLEEL